MRLYALVVQKTLDLTVAVAQQAIEVTERGLDEMLHVYHNIEVHPCLLPCFIVSYKSN